MVIVKKYYLFVLIGVVAAVVGWGASALATNIKSNSFTSQAETVKPSVPALGLTAPAAAPINVAPAISAPVTQPVYRDTPAPVARTRANRPKLVRRTPETGATEVAPAEERAVSSAPAPIERQREGGMSSAAKTAIVIGGGAATGALIGGIASGKKGAAIGAIAGGGGGALYSLIRNKQKKPVF